jgi:hypothetical protein
LVWWGRIVAVAARTGFVGLVTNVACTQAPPGALQEAENVVCRRPGAIEPRDGVEFVETAAGTVVYGFSTNDSDVVVDYAGGSFSWRNATDAVDIQYTDPVDGVTDPQPFRRDMWSHAESRGNSYVPYEAGVLRLHSDENAFEMTGIPAVVTLYEVQTAVAPPSTWLANNEQVAYRVVAHRTDETGLETRSAPSGAVTFSNTSGAAVSTRVSASFDPDWLNTFDDVEVYRTRNFSTSVTVDDEMQLVATIPLASFTLLSGVYYAQITDLVDPAERGATLYTSPSRGGIAQQNNQPPAAAVVAAYKGSLFFGNVRGPFRMVFSFKFGGVVTAAADGVGSRVYTGDTLNGSNTILNASSTVGLEKGMVVLYADFPADTYITGISGTTVTVSQNATNTTVGGSIPFVDAYKINGTWVPVVLSAGYMSWFFSTYAPGGQILTSITPALGGNTHTLVVETLSRVGGTAPTIQATHGDEYTPPLPTYDQTARDYDQDVWPGAVMWTKKDEPEHVAPGAYAFVGDKRKAILGLVPTRDALFILKEDGVFRLTGSGATVGIAAPWRIDPYDPTTRCVLPSSVKPLNGRGYFLSNRGVVAFGDGGAELLSEPINDLLKPVIDTVIAGWTSSGLYELDGVVGSTAAVFSRESEYTLMRSSSDWPLVFNENTRAWTEWKYHEDGSQSYSYKALFDFDRTGRVSYSLGLSRYETRLSTTAAPGTSALTTYARMDGSQAVTASSYNAGTGALTLAGSVSCLQDDVIEDADGKLWRVTNDVNGSATVYLDGLEVYGSPGSAADFTTGACMLYRSLRCRVAPQPYFGAPFTGKCNDTATAMFSRFDGPVKVGFAYLSQLSPVTALNAVVGRDDWTEETMELQLLNGAAPFVTGFATTGVVPNAHARSWLMSAGVRWVMTHGHARLEGLYLHSREMDARTRQQVAV